MPLIVVDSANQAVLQHLIHTCGVSEVAVLGDLLELRGVGRNGFMELANMGVKTEALNDL